MSKKAPWPTLGVALGLGLLALVPGTTTRAATTNCAPKATSVESPRRDSYDVQVKTINDRGGHLRLRRHRGIRHQQPRIAVVKPRRDARDGQATSVWRTHRCKC